MSEQRENIAISKNTLIALWSGICVLALLALYHLSTINYLLFHGIVEGVSIGIAFTIFVIAMNTRRFLQNHYLLFLGMTFPFVGVFDFLHMLSYKGMNVFPAGGANLPTQLWIQARSFQALSMLGAVFFLDRKVRASAIFFTGATVTALLLAATFAFGIFPDCFIEPTGLTPFKKSAEYVISAILLGSLAAAWRKRELIGPKVFAPLAWAIAFMIASEVWFTFYVSVYGFSNMAGHLFKICAFFMIYKGLVEVGLKDPFGSMFLSLQQSRKNLLRAQDALARKNEELEAFIYAAGHDLRTPLTSATGYAQLLKKSLAGTLDPAKESMMDMVLSSLNHMYRLLKDLLDFAHLGERTAPAAPIDTSGLIRGIAEEIRSTVRELNAEIFVPDHLPKLWMSRTKAYQLFMNLISNGLKFSRQGIVPRIEIGVLDVDEGKHPDDPRVFFVRDNGQGIRREKQDKIFELFYTSDEVEGRSTGAGLAIVKRIVEQKGGRIWIESEPDHGTTFYFTLPVSQTAAAKGAPSGTGGAET